MRHLAGRSRINANEKKFRSAPKKRRNSFANLVTIITVNSKLFELKIIIFRSKINIVKIISREIDVDILTLDQRHVLTN